MILMGCKTDAEAKEMLATARDVVLNLGNSTAALTHKEFTALKNSTRALVLLYNRNQPQCGGQKCGDLQKACYRADHHYNLGQVRAVHTPASA